jgi:hypothetical protein
MYDERLQSLKVGQVADALGDGLKLVVVEVPTEGENLENSNTER